MNRITERISVQIVSTQAIRIQARYFLSLVVEKCAMKKYLLLRNNRESGPYSIEQLGSIGLFPLDLIWIENESTCWKYCEEIEQLTPLINYNSSSSSEESDSDLSSKPLISFPYDLDYSNEQSALQANEAKNVDVNENTAEPQKTFEENYRASNTSKPVWNKKLFSSANTASAVAVFIGVMIGAFVVKKIVDDYTPDFSEDAIAVPIIDREPTPQANENFQNALVTEIVPATKNKSSKTTKHTNLKKLLSVKANDYKVGLFGGINGLRLTVFNPSDQVAEKVIVAVDYLKPNGAVIQSQNVVFSSISPKSAQTISVPGSNRGVKIKYRILKAYPHSYKDDLKEV